MPSKRSRKGKQGTSSERSTPVPSEEDTTTAAADETSGHQEENNKDGDNNEIKTMADDSSPSNDISVATPTPTAVPPPPQDLILTSEKRRGVYECDYCHTDISQVPRIRCAVCTDFDLCLECFVSTDHAATAARLRAALATQQALQAEGTAVTTTVGTSGLHHDATHGYRVCDSTRYPVFATAKHVGVVKGVPPAPPSTTAASSNPPSVNGSATGDVDTASNAPDDAVSDDNKKEKSGKSDDNDAMDIDDDDDNDNDKDDKESLTGAAVASPEWNAASLEELATAVVMDDPKTVWTAEEDLRLIEGIRSHGLGNWVEIADVVSGQGSTGKTPRRCMERYMDDFLGRYGHILPPFTVVMEDLDADGNGSATATEEEDEKPEAVPLLDGTPRASKRRAVLLRSPSGVSSSTAAGWTQRKRFKCVPTESLPGYDQVWPKPYLPNDQVQVGMEVGRDVTAKAEQTYVRLTTAASSAEEAAKIRQEWEAERLLKPGGPTVLPPRLDDIVSMSGSELLGFMPRRGDFDIEWENDAEQAVADMEFLPGEPAEDRQLKLQVLAIYNSKLDEREKRKQFILSRKLWDYQKAYQTEKQLPADERDLVHRMRLFERFHTTEEHAKFLADILRAKRLRKEIAKLQMYRRMGIRTLAEAERYELDKQRRLIHRNLQKDDGKKDESNSEKASGLAEETTSTSLWKQYRTGERRNRKSINRGGNGEASFEDKEPKMQASEPKAEPEAPASSLQSTERDLCEKLGLNESQYKQIKRALISESLSQGLLDKETIGSQKRAMVKMDVERKGHVIDFFLRAGWISSKAAASLRQDSELASQST